MEAASKPKLVLVESPPDLSLPEPRNFWNTCPRQLDLMPDSPCSKGKPSKDKRGKIVAEGECPWGINSQKHHFCFWKYLRDRSAPDGTMDAEIQGDIADLLACSSTKVHFTMKEAADKVRNLGMSEELKDMFREAPSNSDSSQDVIFESEVNPDSEEGTPHEAL